MYLYTLNLQQCTYQVCTGEKEVNVDWFHHILFGGDMLTGKRARGSKYVRSNSTRGLDRLEGLLPVAKDWHTNVCLLGVSSNSSRL